ncbi:hypothetical protein LTSEALA_0143 [Salmonella enterica subsp. enterica serovar Alachua str. R6-377]|uniref:Uncharacterized protein n=1 Tax=Salmonella enterica subsp. enterica serovar Alachua str. R6-377 TaxID=913241 RepID=G5LIR6_SALET|nr:hypothetical protein LTSEALA_0143 [Salmonella enterica subsp. enterica serovar Alachua str. R6-377]
MIQSGLKNGRRRFSANACSCDNRAVSYARLVLLTELINSDGIMDKHRSHNENYACRDSDDVAIFHE